jgi:hypothetical protein
MSNLLPATKRCLRLFVLSGKCAAVCGSAMLGATERPAFQGFTDPSNLVINGDATVIVGGEGEPTLIRLTPDIGDKAGSVFSKDQIHSTSFSSYFQFRIHASGGDIFDCNETDGADGLVFVVQSVSSDLGSTGQGIGYAGIVRSIGIEFDTWCNSGNNDPCSNHLAINLNGAVHHDDPETVVSLDTSLENAEVWHVWVDYDGTAVELRLSDTDQRPMFPTLVKLLSIKEILESDTAFIGFTSGTGAAWANHDILLWEHRDSYSPVHTEEGSLQVVSQAIPIPAPPPAPSMERPLLIILDASASMLKTTPEGPPRIQVAKAALEHLVGEVIPTSVPVGIRVFGHRGGADCKSARLIALSEWNRSTALERVRQIRSSSLGNTSLAEALERAKEELQDWGKRDRGDNAGSGKILILTDGEETCGGDPFAAIEGLVEAGVDIQLDIVGFAVDSDSLHDTFQNWTRVGGGSYYEAENLQALTDSLSASVTGKRAKNVQTPFDVLDANRVQVASSLVNGPPLPLKPGSYTVVVHTEAGEVTLRAEVANGNLQLTLP